mmetsp:Transcript_16939/g.27720  ORF Transcript_16939/g.27720 Transcript_16939/m.27720 type:complete len:207 (-) Transcript_16939:442-1062(-)
MSLMRTHNIRKSLLLQKVRNSLVPKTNRSTTTQTISIPRTTIHTILLLFLRRWITPDTIRSHLLIIIIFMLVRGINPSNLGHIQNVLYTTSLHGRIRNRPRDAPMNAKDILIHHRCQRQPIKGLIGRFPHFIPNLFPKPFSTLCNIRSCPIMFFPPIHIPRFMIATQQEHLMGQHQLHRQQVRHHLQTRHAPIDIISQKDKVPGGQ